MSYIDIVLGKVISWIDAGLSFLFEFKHLFVWGFIAIMISKLAKFNFKLGINK